MVQLMPLPPHYLLLQQNPEWFIFLVLTYPGCPGKKACVCACASACVSACAWCVCVIADSCYVLPVSVFFHINAVALFILDFFILS